MIAVRRPLSAAKDSGVQPHWEVPPHWEVRRIKTLFREKDERRRDGSGLLLSLTKAHGLVPQMEASHRPASSEDLSKYKLCRPGDMVMNRMQAWSGMLAVSSREGLVSPDYSVFAAIGPLECRFFEYLFKTRVVVDEFAKASKGIGNGFNRLYTPEFGAIPVAVPPLAEQVAIVRFLDHADRRIQRCIRAKRKLIELLEEQKQAIIHRAVTRGLDPNVRVKPSGVEWLGDVPEHWEVRRIKKVFEAIVGGATPQSTNSAYWDGEVVWVTPADVSMGPRLGASLRRISIAGLRSCSTRLVPRGSVIVTSRAPVGNVAIADTELCTNQGCKALVANPSVVDPEYGCHALATLKGELESTATGTTFKEISTGRLGDIRMPLPPIAEQSTIVRALDDVTTSITAILGEIRREIALLRELRTRLVADAVTGKLDVRDAAAGSPEEDEEMESADDGDFEGEENESNTAEAADVPDEPEE